MPKETAPKKPESNKYGRLAAITTATALLLGACADGGSSSKDKYVMPFVCSGVELDEFEPGESLSEIAAITGIEYPEAAQAVLEAVNPDLEVGDTAIIPTDCVQGNSFYTGAEDGSTINIDGSDFLLDVQAITVSEPDGLNMRDGVAVNAPILGASSNDG